MKLLKPSWISHNGYSILSADFHPDGIRYATCGQNENGGIIIIWNIKDLLKEDYSSSFIETKNVKIAELDDHIGCVNCIKWSPDGKILASGGDDHLVMIWKQARIKRLIPSKNISDFTESWRCVFKLIGHSSDVLDLKWSPTGQFLASCSIDSSIIIWNSETFPAPFLTLKGHSGFVKGIAWDPVGEYLTSQSDDNSLRIWKVSDLKSSSNILSSKGTVITSSISVIRKPFKNCTPTTQFLRLDWSPDGQYIITTHSLNNQGPVSKIIERDNWTHERDLVGHRKAITCVRFNPRIFKASDSKNMNILCAIGSRDCSVSIWRFPSKRPILVIHDLFSCPVMDLTWTSDGKHLSAVSWDGTVSFLNFDNEPLFNTPTLTPQEVSYLHRDLYGKSITDFSSSSEIIIDDIEFSDSHLKSKKAENSAKNIIIQSEPQPSSKPTVINEPQPSDSVAGIEQVETLTKDGRRRIKPILIAQTMDEEDDIGGEPSDPRPERVDKPDLTKAVDFEKPSSLESQAFTPKKRTQSALILPSKKSKLKKEKSSSDSGAEPPNRKLFEEPDIENMINIKVTCVNNKTFNLCIPNTPMCKDPFIYRIDAISEDLIEWSAILTSPATLVSNSDSIICVATTDRQIHVFSTNGLRQIPPLIFKETIALLKCFESKFVMAVSTSGYLSVWDIGECKILLNYIDLIDVMGEGVWIKNVELSPQGLPIVITNDNHSFTYFPDMSSWIPLASKYCSLDLMARSNLIPSPTENPNSINSLQKLYQNSHGHLRGLAKCNHSLSLLCAESYLEISFMVSMASMHSHETIGFLKAYVRILINLRRHEKLRNLFEFLFAYEEGLSSKLFSNPNQTIDKEIFMKEIMDIMAEDAWTQKIYCEVKRVYFTK